MHILIAPDSFKGSLSAEEICTIGRQVKEAYCEDTIKLTTIPLADGGEGTLECILAYGGVAHRCIVEDPLGRRIEARWAEIEEDEGSIGVIEMAQASGLTCLERHEYNPMKTSTYGTGELIMDAIRHGCRSIYVTLGGSATCDGGLGMLVAMGAKLYNRNGQELKGTGEGLVALHAIDVSAIYKLTEGVAFHVAVDVDSPLLGSMGAIYTYGPQKGATDAMLYDLEKGMEHYCFLIKERIGVDLNNYVGGGAAGGLGATLMGVLGAIPEQGADFIMAYSGLHQLLEQEKVDWIITGEGRCDYQTLHGKLPYRVLLEAKTKDIPVIIIAGALEEGYEKLLDEGAVAVLSIASKPQSLEEAMSLAEISMAHCFRNLFSLLTHMPRERK